MDYLKLGICIIICLGAGFLGSIATSQSIDSWYKGLNKPSFNPPNWIFGPVWTLLYILMGISLFLIIRSHPLNSLPVYLFAAQLALNVTWSFLFFGLQSPFLALLEIFILLGFIVATAISFYPISRTAAYLLVPYILWVCFATMLNFSIWRLN